MSGAKAEGMERASPDQLTWARAHLTPSQLQQALIDEGREECPHQADNAIRASHVPDQLGSNARSDMRAQFLRQCLGRSFSTARILADFWETGRIDHGRTVTCLDGIAQSYNWFDGPTAERVYRCAYTAEDMARASRR